MHLCAVEHLFITFWRFCCCAPVNNTSVCKYWKILFYLPNTDTGTFYGGSTDINTDAQYPKFTKGIHYDGNFSFLF